jgi:hypothetical protein
MRAGATALSQTVAAVAGAALQGRRRVASWAWATAAPAPG